MEEQRFAHQNNIRSIKIQFIRDKKVAEDISEVTIKEMASAINKVGINYCHIDFTIKNIYILYIQV